MIDASGAVLARARAAHPPQAGDRIDAALWWDAVRSCVEAQIAGMRAAGLDPMRIRRAAVCGTSGTMTLVDEALAPVTPALMYDSAGFEAESVRIARHAEPDSIARGPDSALARMLRLQELDSAGRARRLLHQADFVLAKLCGCASGSDDNNALKLGYDPESGAWPTWFRKAGVRLELLPEVRRAGAPVGTIEPSLAHTLGLAPDLALRAGTTDSIAAFLAAGAGRVGDAFTSLGTTLAIKILSPKRIDAPDLGVYSHRLGDRWLAGGASNSGGGALAAHFTPAEIAAHSERIDPDTPTGLDYYPLRRPGERFPVRDPALPPRLSPRPSSPTRHLQGMLEGIAAIEMQGYRALEDLGAPAPRRILTAGGGARNAAWTAIRRRLAPAPIEAAQDDEAAVGAARLALGAIPT